MPAFSFFKYVMKLIPFSNDFPFGKPLILINNLTHHSQSVVSVPLRDGALKQDGLLY